MIGANNVKILSTRIFSFIQVLRAYFSLVDLFQFQFLWCHFPSKFIYFVILLLLLNVTKITFMQQCM